MAVHDEAPVRARPQQQVGQRIDGARALGQERDLVEQDHRVPPREVSPRRPGFSPVPRVRRRRRDTARNRDYAQCSTGVLSVPVITPEWRELA